MGNICNICGASYVLKNNKWVCPACGAFRPEEMSNEEEDLIASASQKLRIIDFNEAEDLFQDIITKYPKSARAYWGLVLAKYGIKHEIDYDGKQVLTCYATSYESIYDDRNFKLACKYANKADATYFEEQAQLIEDIRKEWVEKASKEKPYDVFISYKENDVSTNERTLDSRDVFELYTHLKEKGYRVFFARESLKGLTGEKYEPYIFNALNTCKVMLVYGSSVENIMATWVKNEWSRFYKRVQAKEKQPDSLLVLYKKMNVGDLPNPLRSVQGINMADLTALETVDRHIEKIMARTQVPTNRLEKSIIKQEKGHKARSVTYSAVSEKIIGADAYQGAKFDDQDRLNIIRKFIKNGMIENAASIIDKMLETAPHSPDLLTYKFLVINEIATVEDINKTNCIRFTGLDIIDEILKYSEVQSATAFLERLYDSIDVAIKNKSTGNSKFLEFVSHVLPYECSFKKDRIDQFIQQAVNSGDRTLFDLVLGNSSYDNVDQFCIWYNHMASEAIVARNFQEAEKLLDKVKELDEGNVPCRRGYIRVACKSNLPSEQIVYDSSLVDIPNFELIKELLRYQNEADQCKEIKAMIQGVSTVKSDTKVFLELLKFYPRNIVDFKDEIVGKGKELLKQGLFDEALNFFQMASGVAPDDAMCYFYILMAKARVRSEEDIVLADDIFTFDESIPMLSKANDDETKYFMELNKMQKEFLKEKESYESEVLSVMEKKDSYANSIIEKKKDIEKQFNVETRFLANEKYRTEQKFISYLIVLGVIEVLLLLGLIPNGEFGLLFLLTFINILFSFAINGIVVAIRDNTTKRKALKLQKEFATLKHQEKKINDELNRITKKYKYIDQLSRKN